MGLEKDNIHPLTGRQKLEVLGQDDQKQPCSHEEKPEIEIDFVTRR